MARRRSRGVSLTTAPLPPSTKGEPLPTAPEIAPLEGVAAVAGLGLKVILSDAEPLGSLKSLLGRESRGRGRVALVLDLADGREVELDLPEGYRLSAAARQAIKAVPGVTVQEA